jgi:hypothetical protein
MVKNPWKIVKLTQNDKQKADGCCEADNNAQQYA